MRFLSFFGEGVENIYSLLKLDDIDDAMLEGMMNPDFRDARADGRHRLPVRRLLSMLDTVELVTGFLPGLHWEFLNDFSSSSDPEEFLKHEEVLRDFVNKSIPSIFQIDKKILIRIIIGLDKRNRLL